MDAKTLAVGPFTGNVTHNTIRIWGAVHKEDIGGAFIGVVRWKKKTAPDQSFPPSNILPFEFSAYFDGTGIIDIPNRDGATPLDIEDLSPGTTYEIQVCYVGATATLADINWPDAEQSTCFARTVGLDADDHRTRFILGSCREQGPGEDGSSDKPFKVINELIASSDDNAIEAPDFLLMTGDQIYVDLRHGLNTKGFELCRDLYRKQFTETEFSKLMKSAPAYLQMDDHEVDNDWSHNKLNDSDDPKERQKLHDGMKAYNAYQASLTKVFTSKDQFLAYPTVDTPYKQHYWYTIERPDCDFFVMDVRYDRHQNEERWTLRSNGEPLSQKQELLDWISCAQDNKVYFIVTPVPMFPDPKKYRLTIKIWEWVAVPASRKELWTGNVADRNEILDAIDNSNAKFVFLSGDVHCSFISKMKLQSGKEVHNIVSSAFNWMWPGLTGRSFKWQQWLEGYPQQPHTDRVSAIENFVETDNNFSYIELKENKSLEVSIYNVHSKKHKKFVI